ncbi:MAG: serine hydrolase, partial [Chloroflexia bacterium]|nr:serine hydrolase [Chloroflexia bacterium]
MTSLLHRLSRRSLLAGAAATGLAASLPAPGRAQAPAGPWPTNGWSLAEPGEHGVDAALLAEVDARAVGEVPAISALLAVRHGYVVFERYYNGLMAEDPINVRSVTKSVTSTLVGAARRTGLLRGLDARTGDLIPHRIPVNHDPRVEDTTLWQWLTMTSGLQWDAYGDWQRLLDAPDWVAMTLGLPVVGIPGETYV